MKTLILMLALTAFAPTVFAQNCASQDEETTEEVARLQCKVTTKKIDGSDLEDRVAGQTQWLEAYFNLPQANADKYFGCNRSGVSEKYTMVASRNQAGMMKPRTVNLSIFDSKSLDSSKDVFMQNVAPILSLEITGPVELNLPSPRKGTSLNIYCDFTTKFSLGDHKP